MLVLTIISLRLCACDATGWSFGAWGMRFFIRHVAAARGVHGCTDSYFPRRVRRHAGGATPVAGEQRQRLK